MKLEDSTMDVTLDELSSAGLPDPYYERSSSADLNLTIMTATPTASTACSTPTPDCGLAITGTCLI